MVRTDDEHESPLESFEPDTPAGRLSLDVVRHVVGTQWEILPESLKRRAVQVVRNFDSPDELDFRGQHANRREYEYWIEEIFQSLLGRTRREDLLLQFMERLDILIAEGKSDALFAMVLEEVEDGDGRSMCLPVRVSQSIHPEQWKAFRKTIASNQDSRFLRDSTLIEKDLEVRLARYADNYGGEIDSLVRSTLEKRGKARDRKQVGRRRIQDWEDRFWISRIALRSSESHHPNRALLVAYENIGDDLVPKPPFGAAQEWRVIFYLRIAYGQVDHQIRNMRAYVSQHRPAILETVAPSVLSHEVASQAKTVSEASALATETLLRIAKIPGHPKELDAATLLVHHVVQGAIGLNRTFSAFLNLERSSRVERFLLRQAYEDAWQLCRIRLKNIELRVEPSAMEVEFHTDRALLTLVFVNLIANAARAIEEAPWPDGMEPSCNRIELFVDGVGEGLLKLVLANTGPPIPIELRKRIFTQGFSQYADGHGQGLYICSYIAQYLGGELTLMDPNAYGSDLQVAFALTIKSHLETFD